MQIKVLIADDHPLIIAGLRRTIERHDDIALVGEARTAAELLELVRLRRPDIVLMDLRMPGMTGVEAIHRIRRDRPEVKIVVLSACDERATIDRMLAAGASTFVVKSAQTLDVASVIRAQAGSAGQRGSEADTTVGPPGAERISVRPPSISVRSRMPISPRRPLRAASGPASSGAKPLPSSRTSTSIDSSPAAIRTST